MTSAKIILFLGIVVFLIAITISSATAYSVCSGIPYPCSYYTTFDECESAGCTWEDEICSGIPYPCSYYTNTTLNECESHGCIMVIVSTTTTIRQNTCIDTDGGIDYIHQGTVSGIWKGEPYNHDDYCDNMYEIIEYYCEPDVDGPFPVISHADCRVVVAPDHLCYIGECIYVQTSSTTTISQPPRGGCPTLFVYDGKEYKKERISKIHSEEGIDTVDEIKLTVEPAVVDGYYRLILGEQFFPGHSYIDSVKLLVDGEEAKLISAVHSKYKDVTSILEKSDDIRTNTKLWDEIELTFEAEKAEDFIFEIEGYNPLRPPQKIAIGVTPAELSLIVITTVAVIIVVIFGIMKFFAKRKK